VRLFCISVSDEEKSFTTQTKGVELIKLSYLLPVTLGANEQKPLINFILLA
jgi:hypothetical protein